MHNFVQVLLAVWLTVCEQGDANTCR